MSEIEHETAIDSEMEIELNGAPYRVPPQHTLAQLIDALALTGQALALAVNRSVVPRQQWPQRQLQAQDKVDIVRAIGGG
ncbi:sulfur carrier protein ThiS [Duganella fentianensis]|uniref:sulfur carrier protein ThiS n=1 Tax=Duganella fentianensis TaxID=2692177 RepID=UPI0032B1935F